MMRTPRTATVIAAGLLLVAAAASAGETATWVTSDGAVVDLHDGHHNMFFSEGDHESFDLSDLADGETRVIGVGDKQVTVSRSGDEATIHRDAAADDSELNITCRLSSDTCKVISSNDDPEQVVIVIQKSRECVDGEGDCDIVIQDFDGAEAHAIVIERRIECDEEGNCEENDFHRSMSHGGHARAHGAGHAVVQIDAAGHGGDAVFFSDEGNVFVLGESDHVMLRCPEGDTRMTVDKEKADDVYLCPEHSVALEQVKAKPHMTRTIQVKTKKSED